MSEKSETDLSFKLHCKKHNLKISYHKTNVVEFQEKYPVRTKIIIENKIIEQVQYFNYLASYIAFNEDKDINFKLHRHKQICGTINKTSRHICTDKQMKFNKVMTVPIFMYGRESTAMKKRDLNHIKTKNVILLSMILRAG